MNISTALTTAKKILSSSESKGLDAILLLSSAANLTKEQIIFNPEAPLNTEQEEQFFQLVERRKNHEPISHLIGKREFFGRDFIVTAKVLDPRPDSEILIELALKNAKKNSQILEIGVGSGCLIITLLTALPEATGTGLDLSKEALEIAVKNATQHQVSNRLTLTHSNLFSALTTTEKFDLIISNPPYIPSAEIENLQDEVKIYEPRMALDGGLDGYDFYRRIAAEAKNFLQSDGAIIVEIGFGQQQKVSEIFSDNGLILTESKHDLAGIERSLCFKNHA